MDHGITSLELYNGHHMHIKNLNAIARDIKMGSSVLVRSFTQPFQHNKFALNCSIFTKLGHLTVFRLISKIFKYPVILWYEIFLQSG